MDFMFFADTDEVFMAMPGFEEPEKTGKPAHRCIQSMDKPMQGAANALLAIGNDTSNMTKTRIKTRLLLSYSRYMPEVNRCNGNQLAVEDDPFGDESFGY
ncbi:hypothetical protein R50073_09550 [Maricurvus nonylphenolicus]